MDQRSIVIETRQEIGCNHHVHVACLCFLALLASWGCNSSTSPSAQSTSSQSSQSDHWQNFIKPSSRTPKLKAKIALKPQGSVGSAACAECHTERTKSFQNTNHAQSARWIDSSTASTATPTGNISFEKSGRTLSVEYRDGQQVHQEVIRSPNGQLISTIAGEPQLEIGSGEHAHSYLLQRGGFWVQSPLTWYESNKSWGLSPGYDHTRATFDRVVSTGCVFCHVNQVAVHNADMHRFEIKEPGIGCERCHGSGAEHVRFHRQNSEGEQRATSIVPTSAVLIKPSELDRDSIESICSQCHLQGIVSTSQYGFDHWDYLQTELFADSVTEYQVQGLPNDFKVVGHMEQMRASRCYQESNTLTCTTCHNPHGDRPSRSAYRAFCLDCHDTQACGVDEGVRIKSNDDDCNACHMPKRQTNVVHASLHDHQIAVHEISHQLAGTKPSTKEELDKRRSSDAELVAISTPDNLSETEKQRRWVLAIHSLAFRGDLPPELQEEFLKAQTLLLKLHRSGETDSRMQVSLAKDYFSAGLLDPAKRLAEQVVSRKGVDSWSYTGAVDLLAQISILRTDNSSALRWYTELTELRRVPGDYFMLGTCLQNAGNLDTSVRAMERALQIDPTLLPAHEDIARLLRISNQQGRSELHEDIVRQLRIMANSESTNTESK